LILLALCLATIALAAPNVETQFTQFLNQYGLHFEGAEYAYRLGVFADNLKRAAVLQAENPRAEFGVTKFSHLTQEEFARFYLGSKPDLAKLAQIPEVEYSPPFVASPFVPDPKNYNWTQAGAITPVKDQEQCGSCWAFSATETVESYWFLAGNALPILSPEQIVDCTTTCLGCGGGWPYLAYEYLEKAGGLDSDKDYPYIAGNGKTPKCHFNNSNPVVAKITGYTKLKNEGAIYDQVSTNGPVSVCVDASTWSSYKKGILTKCAKSVDHCVQVIGYANYGSDGSYWIVRNSWNADWGENGYIYLETGKDLCAIGEYATIVNI